MTEQDINRFAISEQATDLILKGFQSRSPEEYIDMVLTQAKGNSRQAGTQPAMAMFWESLPRNIPEFFCYVLGSCIFLDAITQEAQIRRIQLAPLTREQVGIKAAWVIGGNILPADRAGELKTHLAQLPDRTFPTIFQIRLMQFAPSFRELLRGEAAELVALQERNSLLRDMWRYFTEGVHSSAYLLLKEERGSLRFRTLPPN